MDILKEEIERKRKQAIQETMGKKYIKRGDLEKKQPVATVVAVEPTLQEPAKVQEDSFKLDLSPQEITRKLRQLKEPVRLFGESEDERLERLKIVASSERTSTGQRNDYMKAMESTDAEAILDLLKQQNGVNELELNAETRRKQRDEILDSVDTTDLSPKLYQSDPERARLLIHVYLKKMLREWDHFLDERTVEVKQSVQGKKAATIYKQSAENIKPFFKKLKKDQIDGEAMALIAEICHESQSREYIKANDAYLRLSIGNAAWPLGVTSVGIHDRSARERIGINQTAHALNDETQRKWVQAIKRILTFCQTKYPPDDLSKCTDAWSVSADILNNPELPLEAKIFAAQTLRQKIQQDLGQLDESARNSLKDSIVSFLGLNNLKVLNTQFALCLVDLTIQMPQWTSATTDWMHMFPTSIVLELLTLLPEEMMHNLLIPLDRVQINERSEALLAKPSQHVFDLLLALLQKNQETDKVLQCLASWLKSGDISLKLLANTPIVQFLFQSLTSPNIFDVCVECICEIILASGGDLIKAQENQNIISQVYTGLVSVLPTIKSRDEDELKGLCRMFVEAGESYSNVILMNYDAFKGIIEAILEFTSLQDLEVVKITFNFWYILSQDLVTEEFAGSKAIFIPIYTRLLENMLQLLHYPMEEDWTAEERDEFRDFRHVIGDVLKDCVQILGEDQALSKPFKLLQSMTTSTVNFHNIPWQQIEAILFSFRTMGSKVSNDSSIIAQVMDLLPMLPAHAKVKYCAILLIGRYSDWTRLHPEYLTSQLNYISSGFQEAECTSAAALSLKYLFESCGSLLVGHLSELHPFYNDLMERIPLADRNEVTEAVAFVLNQVPFDQLLDILRGFCNPIGKQLEQLISIAPTEESVQKTKELLSRISLFVRHIKRGPSVHPCVELFKDFWPMYSCLLDSLGNINIIAESFSKVTRATIESSGQSFMPVLQLLLPKVGQLYQMHGHSAYLWIATQCIKEFAMDNNDCTSALYEFSSGMCAVTFGLIEKEPISCMAEVVEDFYGLTGALLNQSPTKFSESRLFEPLLGFCKVCLKTEDKPALLAVLYFLDDLMGIEKKLSNQQVVVQIKQYFMLHASGIIDILIQGLLVHFPRDKPIINLCSKIVISFKDISLSVVLERLNAALTEIPVEIMNLQEKSSFMTNANACLEARDAFKMSQTLNDFSITFRRRHLALERLKNKKC